MNFIEYINTYQTSLILDLLTYTGIICAILVITTINPIVSLFYLIALFLNVAIYLEMAGINLLGLIYILVYVGAIAILLLFIIMLLDIKIADNYTRKTNDIPLSSILIGGMLYIWYVSLRYAFHSISGRVYMGWLENLKINIDKIFNVASYQEIMNGSIVDFTKHDPHYKFVENNPEIIRTSNLGLQAEDIFETVGKTEILELGKEFYGLGAVNFIIISFILLLAIIAAIVVTRNSPVVQEH